jgi:TonB family protein
MSAAIARLPSALPPDPTPMRAGVTMDRTGRIEDVAYRRRTGWSMSASIVAHMLVMLWIILLPHVTEQLPALTEITLIEPGALSGANAGGTPAPATYARSGAPTSHATDESFRRTDVSADVTPEPESPSSFADRITSRLASLQQNEPLPVRGASTSSALTTVWGPPAATGAIVGGGGNNPLALNRGGTGVSTGPPLSLNRGGSGPAPAIVSTGLPSGGGAASAPAHGGETNARRIPAGAMLAGPIADRPVIAYTRPIYPEWAKRDAVEGSVTLYFVVRPDGSIKENVLVQKTAGFEDFDESARTALRAWRFAPLREGRTGEQWGTITFHFRLREAG